MLLLYYSKIQLNSGSTVLTTTAPQELFKFPIHTLPNYAKLFLLLVIIMIRLGVISNKWVVKLFGVLKLIIIYPSDTRKTITIS